jgi:hypothetical protein
MSYLRNTLRAISRLGVAILRRPWGQAAVVLIPLGLWLAGVPVIRLCYGAVILPLRSTQYYFSLDRPDAQRLSQLTSLIPGRGAITGYLDLLGLWAVLRALRREDLSLKQQAIALAIVHQESRFRFYVKNPQSTACGLYQLVAATGKAKDLPWWTCMDPLANGRAGSALVREFNAEAFNDFSGALRCAYLKHYYGSAHSCSSDPQRIWTGLAKNMTGRGLTYLQALQQIKAEHERAGFFLGAWEVLVQYLPLAILVFCVWAYRRIRPKKARQTK